MEGNQTPQQPSGSPKGGLMAAIIIVLIIILAGAAYAIYRNNNKESANTDSQTTDTQSDTMSQDQMDNMGEDTNATSTASSTPVMTDTTTLDTTIGIGQTAVKSFTVTGQNFSFSPNEIKVKKGDKVKITFKNSGGNHNFVLDAFNVKTDIINSGESATVEFTADKTGTFEYYCGVGTHRAMGMKGNLIVE